MAMQAVERLSPADEHFFRPIPYDTAPEPFIAALALNSHPPPPPPSSVSPNSSNKNVTPLKLPLLDAPPARGTTPREIVEKVFKLCEADAELEEVLSNSARAEPTPPPSMRCAAPVPGVLEAPAPPLPSGAPVPPLKLDRLAQFKDRISYECVSPDRSKAISNFVSPRTAFVRAHRTRAASSLGDIRVHGHITRPGRSSHGGVTSQPAT